MAKSATGRIGQWRSDRDLWTSEHLAVQRDPRAFRRARHRANRNPDCLRVGDNVWIPGSRQGAPRNDRRCTAISAPALSAQRNTGAPLLAAKSPSQPARLPLATLSPVASSPVRRARRLRLPLRTFCLPAATAGTTNLAAVARLHTGSDAKRRSLPTVSNGEPRSVVMLILLNFLPAAAIAIRRTTARIGINRAIRVCCFR
jgi:hypothetical protein